MKRCSWCNLDNELYVLYHDQEWGVENFSDEYLFEMLILESFQAGLSWECVLNKRESFRAAYDNFSLDKVCNYDDEKIKEFLQELSVDYTMVSSSNALDVVYKMIKEDFYEQQHK